MSGCAMLLIHMYHCCPLYILTINLIIIINNYGNSEMDACFHSHSQCMHRVLKQNII